MIESMKILTSTDSTSLRNFENDVFSDRVEAVHQPPDLQEIMKRPFLQMGTVRRCQPFRRRVVNLPKAPF